MDATDPAARGLNGELLELAVDAARMAGGLLLERAGHGVEADVRSKSTSVRPTSPPSGPSASCSPQGGPAMAFSERRGARPRGPAA